MKKTNVIYWIFTVLLVIGILPSGILEVLQTTQGAMYITALGYPAYLVPFLGMAKILGIIAILVPKFPRLKEWAYAGIAFDLIGATYSEIAKAMPPIAYAFMSIWFIVLFGSYLYYHKKLKATV